MRTLLTTIVASFVALPLAAQDHHHDHGVRGGELPAGWSARTDRNQPLDNVHFRPMGDGLHITVGPAVILYREADAVDGPHRVSATFTQTRAPQHPEAYGLFIGGRDLQGDGQRYTYFLIRGDGQFLIRRRDGAQVSDVAGRWAPHDAILKQDERGRQTNEMAVVVSDGRASFRVNGTEVHSAAASEVDVAGIAGMRVNHNLDLHIDGFEVRSGG